MDGEREGNCWEIAGPPVAGLVEWVLVGFFSFGWWGAAVRRQGDRLAPWRLGERKD